MIRDPVSCDTYINGPMEMRIYRFEDPLAVKYQIKAGVSFIELGEEEYEKLLDILAEYEVDFGFNPKFWQKLRRKS